MKLSTIVSASLLAISTTYCWAADESKLDLIYKRGVQLDKQPPQVQTMKVPVQARTGTCMVAISTPIDARRNKDTLGTTFRDNPILSNQTPTVWLETALMDLKGEGFNTVSSKPQGEPSALRITTLTADLDKLYVWNHSLNLHATLVVRAKIRSAGGETLEKTYRVTSTKLNWVNADAEFVDTLNLAAGRLLEQIAADLDGSCSNKTST